MSFYFRKNEKLTSEKEIDLLFASGRSSFIYPIKSIFTSSSGQIGECKVLVTVSKRYFKNASERNLIKRRLREAYRLNAVNLKEIIKEKNISASVAFIYNSSKTIPFEKIEQIVIKHIANIMSLIEKNENDD